jgi:hypothetical protein
MSGYVMLNELYAQNLTAEQNTLEATTPFPFVDRPLPSDETQEIQEQKAPPTTAYWCSYEYIVNWQIRF